MKRKITQRLFLAVFCLFFQGILWGQTQKIHTLEMNDGTLSGSVVMNADALIDMQSSKKGLLLPRVALVDAKKPAPLTAHTAGMTVYNTATVSSTASVEGVAPGYYYNNGTKWVRLTTEVEAEWKDGTNLIYAKQAKEAGNEVVILDDGRIGIGTNTPAKHTVLDIVKKGEIHLRDGGFVSDRFQDEGGVIAIDNSTKIGDSEAASRWALYNMTGRYSKGLHFWAYRWNSSTNSFDILGSKMVLRDNGNVGIGTENPQAKLDVNGKVRIADGSQQAGRVLTSDANGVGTWQALSMGNKTTEWKLVGAETFKKDQKMELKGNGSFEGADEIGLTMSGNEVSLPAGKYIAFINFDVFGHEYGNFFLKDNDKEIFSIAYGEWLGGSTILIRSSKTIKLKAVYEAEDTGIQYFESPPYTRSYGLRIIFLKLN